MSKRHINIRIHVSDPKTLRERLTENCSAISCGALDEEHTQRWLHESADGQVTIRSSQAWFGAVLDVAGTPTTLEKALVNLKLSCCPKHARSLCESFNGGPGEYSMY